MPQEFALCGPFDKEKVRYARNDTPIVWLHDVRMVRETKARAVWYAKEWLKAKELKQAHVVARTSFNKGQVSDYVTGARRWNEDVLVAFAHAIGIDAADLLKPPHAIENELARYVMKMDAKARAKALKVLKAHFEDDEGGEQVA